MPLSHLCSTALSVLRLVSEGTNAVLANKQTGRGGNQPRFNRIEGNLIHHLGLYTKQSCAVFSAVSCQNTIAENVMFHGPRAVRLLQYVCVVYALHHLDPPFIVHVTGTSTEY